MVDFRLLSHCAFNIKKKRAVNLVSSADTKDIIVQYANRYQVGEVNVLTGKVSKHSYPALLKDQIICIQSLQGSASLVGILNSGDVFFYIPKKSLIIIEGPHNLLVPDEYKARTNCKSSNPFHQIQSYFKRNDSMQKIENLDSLRNSGEIYHYDMKPQVFTSCDTTKVLLIASWSEIFLWEKISSNDHVSLGMWKVIRVPADQPMPTKECKAKAINVSFHNNGPTGPMCSAHIGFINGLQMTLSSLFIIWNGCSYLNNYDPSVQWTHRIVSLKAIDTAHTIPNQRTALLIKVSLKDDFIYTCLNSLSNKFYLLSGNIESRSFNVVNVAYPDVISSTGNRRLCWVAALSWLSDSLLLGCLKSGHLFIISRMGSLLKIICDGGACSEPTYFLTLFPDSRFDVARGDDSSISVDEAQPTKCQFSIAPFLMKNAFVVCSGFQLRLFTVPCDAVSDKDVASFLLKRTHSSNHSFKDLCSEHHYDYIHCSSWRLARSLVDVSGTYAEGIINNTWWLKRLWLPGNVSTDTSSVSAPLTSVERQMKKTFENLLSSWNFIASCRAFDRKDKKSLTRALLAEASTLLETILTASPVTGDHEENQARLIQSLRLFHQLLLQLEINTFPPHMIRPTQKLCHRLFHLVIKSTNDSFEMKLAYIVVLTQTLSVVERQFSGCHVTFRKHWFCLYKCVAALWKEKNRSAAVRRKIGAITGLLQEKVLPFSHLYHPLKVDLELEMLLSGKCKTGLQRLKEKIQESILYNSVGKYKKFLSYGFYSLLRYDDFPVLIDFVSWCFYETVAPPVGDGGRLTLLEALLSLIGSLGVVLARSLLAKTGSLRSKNALDLPEEFSEELRLLQFDVPDRIMMSLVVLCLVMGGRWRCVHFLATLTTDTKLALISALVMKENGESELCLENTVESALFSYLETPGHLSFTPEDFGAVQDLVQFAAMLNCERVLPKALMKCLDGIDQLMATLPLIVHDGFHLPSPPLFCPQWEEDPMPDDWMDEPYSCLKEKRIRYETWYHISCFSFLVSAAGLNSLLLLHDLESYSKTLPVDDWEEFQEILSALLPKTVTETQLEAGMDWKEVVLLWKRFLEVLWSLHVRDKVSVAMREWIFLRTKKQQVSAIHEKCQTLLHLAKEAFECQEKWRQEALMLLISSAFDAPPEPENISAVAAAVNECQILPSLISDRYKCLLQHWQGMNVDLQSLLRNSSSQGSKKDCNAPAKFELLRLYFSVAVVKLEVKFEHEDVPYPFLSEFGTQLKDIQFTGMSLASALVRFPSPTQTKHSLPAGSRDSEALSATHVSLGNKRGYFRNIPRYLGSDTTQTIFCSDSMPLRRSSYYQKGETLVTVRKRSHSLGSAQRKDKISCRKVKLPLISLTVPKLEDRLKASLISNIYSFPSGCPTWKDFSGHLPEDLLNTILWIVNDNRRLYSSLENSGDSAKGKETEGGEENKNGERTGVTKNELKGTVFWISLKKNVGKHREGNQTPASTPATEDAIRSTQENIHTNGDSSGIDTSRSERYTESEKNGEAKHTHNQTTIRGASNLVKFNFSQQNRVQSPGYDPWEPFSTADKALHSSVTETICRKSQGNHSNSGGCGTPDGHSTASSEPIAENCTLSESESLDNCSVSATNDNTLNDVSLSDLRQMSQSENGEQMMESSGNLRASRNFNKNKINSGDEGERWVLKSISRSVERPKLTSDFEMKDRNWVLRRVPSQRCSQSSFKLLKVPRLMRDTKEEVIHSTPLRLLDPKTLLSFYRNVENPAARTKDGNIAAEKLQSPLKIPKDHHKQPDLYPKEVVKLEKFPGQKIYQSESKSKDVECQAQIDLQTTVESKSRSIDTQTQRELYVYLPSKSIDYKTQTDPYLKLSSDVDYQTHTKLYFKPSAREVDYISRTESALKPPTRGADYRAQTEHYLKPPHRSVDYYSQTQPYLEPPNGGTNYQTQTDSYLKAHTKGADYETQTEPYLKAHTKSLDYQTQTEPYLEPHSKGVDYQTQTEPYLKPHSKGVDYQTQTEPYLKPHSKGIDYQTQTEPFLKPHTGGVDYQSQTESYLKRYTKGVDYQTQTESYLKSHTRGVDYQMSTESFLKQHTRGIDYQSQTEPPTKGVDYESQTAPHVTLPLKDIACQTAIDLSIKKLSNIDYKTQLWEEDQLRQTDRPSQNKEKSQLEVKTISNLYLKDEIPERGGHSKSKVDTLKEIEMKSYLEMVDGSDFPNNLFKADHQTQTEQLQGNKNTQTEVLLHLKSDGTQTLYEDGCPLLSKDENGSKLNDISLGFLETSTFSRSMQVKADPNENPSRPSATACLQPRNVTVDLCQPLLNGYHASDQKMYCVDIPEDVVKKQLADSGLTIGSGSERALGRPSSMNLSTSHEIGKQDIEGIGSLTVEVSQRESDQIVFSPNGHILNEFLRGNVTLDEVCDQMVINEKSRYSPFKERLSHLIQEVATAQEDIWATKDTLSKVDKIIDTISHQELIRSKELKRTTDVQNTAKLLPKKFNFSRRRDIESFVKEVSPRDLNSEVVSEILDKIKVGVLTKKDDRDSSVTSSSDVGGNATHQNSLLLSPQQLLQKSPKIPLDLSHLRNSTTASWSAVSSEGEESASRLTQKKAELREWMKRRKERELRQKEKTFLATRDEPPLLGKEIRQLQKESERRRSQQKVCHSKIRRTEFENIIQSLKIDRKALERSLVFQTNATPPPKATLNGSPHPRSLSFDQGLDPKDIKSEIDKLFKVISSPSSKRRIIIRTNITKASHGTQNETSNNVKNNTSLAVSQSEFTFGSKSDPSVGSKSGATLGLRYEPSSAKYETNLDTETLNFERPKTLDPISEEDSASSTPSEVRISEGNENSTCSSDSSWNMPEDIKLIMKD